MKKLAVFIVNTVKKSVNYDLYVFRLIKYVACLLAKLIVDLARSVPAIGIVSDSDLTAKQIILIPVGKANGRPYLLTERFAKLVEDLIILHRVIAWELRARSASHISQIRTVIPAYVVKAKLQGDGNFYIFHIGKAP